jgi:putative oxidoreductase
MRLLFISDQVYSARALAFVRIVVGLLMIYHGKEVFDASLMQEYAKWESFKDQSAVFMVYAGKSSELIAGILLTVGFLTRIGSILLTGTMAYITFFVGHGRFWYEDQHPFMFVLFGILFFFTGAGAWSIDKVLFDKSK